MRERISNVVLQIVAESVGTRGEGAYLVDVKVKGNATSRKIEILMDADCGIRIHQCAWFSRRIREKIEADDELMDFAGENFDLMVSSPGLGEPVIIPRQYIRHIGKLLRVRYTDSEGEPAELSGHLLDVSFTEDGKGWIVLKQEAGKKRKPTSAAEGMTLSLDQVICAIPEAEL
ncbi:MAG: ribosome maturation factor RimP [Chlorobium sp.]